MTFILSFISVNSSTANASPGPYSSSLHVDISFLSNNSVFSFANTSLFKFQIQQIIKINNLKQLRTKAILTYRVSLRKCLNLNHHPTMSNA